MKNHLIYVFSAVVCALLLFPVLAVEGVSSGETTLALVISPSELYEKSDATSKSLSEIEMNSIVKVLPPAGEKEIKVAGGFYYVEYNGVKGWIPEESLSLCSHKSKDGKKFAWMDVDGGFIFYDLKKNKISTFSTEGAPENFEMSESFRYIAIKNSSYSIPRLEIHNVATGEFVYRSPYNDNRLEWKGEKIVIEKYVGQCKEGRLQWEEEIFNDGKVSKGTRKGYAECADGLYLEY